MRTLLCRVLCLLSARQMIVSGHRDCGTREIDERGDFLQKRAVSLLDEEGQREGGIVIPMCFHILINRNGDGNVTNDQLQMQFDHLNKAFTAESCCDPLLDWCDPGDCSQGTGISFTLATLDDNGELQDGTTTMSTNDTNACITRTMNNNWANGRNQANAKAATRKGGKSTLNVWFADIDLLGFTYFPWEDESRSLTLDGVMCRSTAISGGELPSFSEGDTLVHEVGHWLGLAHTFTGGCLKSDGITDTAPQRVPHTGCDPANSHPDTCLDSHGRDPIFNFMDYSDDQCMFEFTEGQIKVMNAAWNMYKSENTVKRSTIELSLDEISGPLYMVYDERQLFQIDVSTVSNGVVECKTNGTTEGNADLYLTVDGDLNFDDSDSCFSEIRDESEEDCCAVIDNRLERELGLISSVWRTFTRFLFGQHRQRKSGCAGPTKGQKMYVGVRAAAYDAVLSDLRVTCQVSESQNHG